MEGGGLLGDYFEQDATGGSWAPGGTRRAAAVRDAAGCRVRLSAAELRDRKWDSSGGAGAGERRSPAFCSALRQFLCTGVCWLESGALSPTTVTACRSSAIDHLATIRSELGRQKRQLLQASSSSANGDPDDSSAHRTAALLRCDFAELTERDGGRVDMRYRMDEAPFSDPSIVFNPLWFPLVAELLGGVQPKHGEGGVCLLYACVMVAEGTSRGSVSASTQSAQKWHGDGGHIFEHAHQPPHCINVFVPLDDLRDTNGPTEFVPGTHVLNAFGETAQQEQDGSFPIKAKSGGVIVFDYRLKHRGGLNSSPDDRLLLCLCYAKPWFQDLGNPRSRTSLLRGQAARKPWAPRLLRADVARAMLARQLAGRTAPVQAATPTARSTVDETAPPETAGGAVTAGVREECVLFQMDVQLGEGKSGTLTVREGDVPTELAAVRFLGPFLEQ